MKNKMKFILSIVGMSLILSLGSIQAQESKPRDFTQSPLFQELNLQSSQKEKIQKIHENYRESMKQKREAVKEAKKNLEQAMLSDADDTTLRKYFSSFQNARSEMMKLHFEQALEIRKILTPEQRKKFEEAKKKMKESKGWGRGHDHSNL